MNGKAITARSTDLRQKIWQDRGGHLIINGQSPDSDLVIDNSGETDTRTGKLTATEFTHTSTLAESLITFSSFDKLEVWLGIGNDRLFVDQLDRRVD